MRLFICKLTRKVYTYKKVGCYNKILFNSAILSPVFWSWVIKPICKYFNIDYKDINILD